MLSDVCGHIRTPYKTGWYLHTCVCDGSAMLTVVGCRLQLCRCFSTVSLHKSFTLSLPLLKMDLWRNPSRPLTTFSSPQRLSCSTLTDAWDAQWDTHKYTFSLHWLLAILHFTSFGIYYHFMHLKLMYISFVFVTSCMNVFVWLFWNGSPVLVECIWMSVNSSVKFSRFDCHKTQACDLITRAEVPRGNEERERTKVERWQADYHGSPVDPLNEVILYPSDGTHDLME